MRDCEWTNFSISWTNSVTKKVIQKSVSPCPTTSVDLMFLSML